MVKKNITLTKILAIVGTILTWFPILAPLFFSLISLTRRPFFNFDYLMPAELFPAVLLGGILLLWAAFRAESSKKLIGWGFGLSIGFPILGQILATVTGLASGETEPVGIWWALVLAALGLYVLAVIVTGIGGILLLRELFKPKHR